MNRALPKEDARLEDIVRLTARKPKGILLKKCFGLESPFLRFSMEPTLLCPFSKIIIMIILMMIIMIIIVIIILVLDGI